MWLAFAENGRSMHVTAIIAAGGVGRRVGAAVPKQLLTIGGRTMLERSVDAFKAHPAVTDVIVALPPSMMEAPPGGLEGTRLVPGGARRQDSVANAFDVLPDGTDVVLVHDAARPFVAPEVITRAIDGAVAHGAAIAAVPVSDTVKRVEGEGRVIVETVPRDTIFLAQTPQAFRRQVLAAAVAVGRGGVEATDEAMLAERAGYRVHVVAGDAGNIKITSATDVSAAMQRLDGMPSGASRVGVGYDLHRLVEGRPLILAGVSIPCERGALGHSDADVVCHAVTDALLGAARLGDIGQHFPDTDARWKDASSVALLNEIVTLVRQRRLQIENVDVVVVLERPKLGAHRSEMEAGLADALGIDVSRVSVKAKTNEGVDAVGRGEAIAAHAVALLSPAVF
jgi:2-C-methyl-D-erythritol 4-phosphate cytidylyltransferase/2-C-methyl-D-erythritol 2,4-cyclodiphosphate synthase